MAVELNHTSVVVLGRWNPAILSPQWLLTQGIVTAPEGGEVHVQGIMGSGGEIVFGLGGVSWEVSAPKLAIKSGAGDDCGRFAAAVLEKLGHTPVGAIGVNFAYNIPEGEFPDDMLPTFGRFEQPTESEESNLRQIRVRVSLARGENGACHIAVEHTPGLVVLSYNYHENVASADEAKAIAARWAEYRDASVHDLRETFGLEFTWPHP
jgi:hypothetical protein